MDLFLPINYLLCIEIFRKCLTLGSICQIMKGNCKTRMKSNPKAIILAFTYSIRFDLEIYYIFSCICDLPPDLLITWNYGHNWTSNYLSNYLYVSIGRWNIYFWIISFVIEIEIEILFRVLGFLTFNKSILITVTCNNPEFNPLIFKLMWFFGGMWIL